MTQQFADLRRRTPVRELRFLQTKLYVTAGNAKIRESDGLVGVKPYFLLAICSSGRVTPRAHHFG